MADTSRDPLRRTRRWARLWMVLALLTGLGATLMVARVLRKNRPTTVRVETQQVVVAATSLPMATTIAKPHLRMVDWPKEAVPAGAFTSVDDLAGRVVKETIIEGEPVVAARLTDKDAGVGLTAVIPEDMRAMSVKVNEVIGVAGFIHPNDRVDVIAVMPSNHNSDKDEDRLPRAKVILQNIQVLAVGQEMVDTSGGQKPKPVSVVTLLVLPDDAERLALAAEEGRIRLAMRNPIDQYEVETAGIIPPTLMTEGLPEVVPETGQRRIARRQPKAAAKPAEDPFAVVEVFRGAKLEERKIRPASQATPTP